MRAIARAIAAGGVNVSHQALSQALSKAPARPRTAAAKPLAPHDALDVLDRSLRELRRIKRGASAAIALRAIDSIRKVVDTRSRVEGVIGDEHASDLIITNVVELAGLALDDEDADVRLFSDEPAAWIAKHSSTLTSAASCLETLGLDATGLRAALATKGHVTND